MRVRVYGGRSGWGEEWEEEFELDSDTTKEDIKSMAQGLSEDFIDFLDGDIGGYDCWYDWDVMED